MMTLSETAGGETAEVIAALRRQMAVLEEQLEALGRQQAAVRSTFGRLLTRFPDGGLAAEVEPGAAPLLQRCAADIVRILREVARPLGTLEILEELAARHLCWRESTVRHVLEDLKNDGVVREGDGERPLSYGLAKP